MLSASKILSSMKFRSFGKEIRTLGHNSLVSLHTGWYLIETDTGRFHLLHRFVAFGHTSVRWF